MAGVSDGDLFYEERIPLGTLGTSVLSAHGSLGHTFILRLKPGTDLFTGIRAVCEENDVRAGVILCAIGSLQNCHMGHLKPSAESTFKGAYEHVRLPGPLEFCGGQGTLSEMEDGKIEIHMHAVLADRHGRCYSGHVFEGDNIVLANMEIVIAQIENVEMKRVMDPEIGGALITPQRKLLEESHD